MLSVNAALIPGKTVMYSTYAFIITKKTVIVNVPIMIDTKSKSTL